MLIWQHLLDGMISKHHQDLFATHAFLAQGLSAMLVSPGTGSCSHHRFARALARCHCKQLVPGRLIGLGVRSFRLQILPNFTKPNFCYELWKIMHDVQLSCAINEPLLAHHWRVHQCLLTSRFIALSISWGVSAPVGKMLKQLLKDHNFLNNSPIFIIESSTINIFAFQKALHTIHFNLKSCFGFGERYFTP